MDFCTTEGFSDRYLMTEKKLVYFLDTQVLNRPLQGSRYLKSRTDIKGSSIIQTLGHLSIKAYASAIVDLWRF
jgi:hypothetical protein